MKRLLLIGVAACAFAALPMLSASAMPRASADQLVSDTDSPVILAHRGHMAMAAITAGVEATITVGDSRRAEPAFLEAA